MAYSYNKYQSSTSKFPTKFIILVLICLLFFLFLKIFISSLEKKVAKIQKNPNYEEYKELLGDDGELKGAEKQELYKELMK